MPQTHLSGRRPAAAVIVILLLGCICLAACGGSSNTTSSSANAASTGTASGTSSTGTSSTSATSTGTSSTGTTPASGARGGAARFAAMRECLQKNGITLPARPRGAGGPRGGGFLGGGGAGPTLPKGVTRAQYEAALKKCGGGRFNANGHFGRTNNPVFKAALTKFAECLRQNGINVPAPNTSGNGPIFDTKGIDTSSAQFKSAESKCRSTLTGALRRPGGAGAAPGAGAPGSGGPPPGGESSG